MVLDLFGTLVDAPTRCERSRSSARLAATLDCDTATVEMYFRDSWRQRHDGTVSTLDALATHLVSATNSSDTMIAPVVKELQEIGLARLLPGPTVIDALTKLRARGVRLLLKRDDLICSDLTGRGLIRL